MATTQRHKHCHRVKRQVKDVWLTVPDAARAARRRRRPVTAAMVRRLADRGMVPMLRLPGKGSHRRVHLPKLLEVLKWYCN